jgi:predicted glycosyltransferase
MYVIEIKYESLLADHYNIKKELEVKEKIIRELKTLNEKLSISVDERSNKHEEWGIEKRGLLEEV